MQCLSTAHTFDYIVLRSNPVLTSCKDLATVVDIIVCTIISACNGNVSYILPYRCMYVWDNKFVLPQ